ncbi:uncharacterized protein J7T54_004440 [Emericellopsis cladophorae]|uniref:Uncharacterized protein n=1 Tax=Emericellopsis cladophorae TaxID=2686198 RepID=A0A9P9Y5F0_9HYPO|nr:uncharacterized protein J7T54_004440 [Emericellopsis cladophorae]KAI6783413.1 hypothetical protein J7T54_004440 [Emericellopsis cladophorae]
MIIIDEAQNLNKAATFIAMANYPRASFVLIIGDINQSTLVSAAAEDNEYNDFFDRQHATSLLDRLAKCNKIDFTLMNTHRPFGNAFEIPRQMFYRETMSVVHGSHLVQQNKSWLSRLIFPTSNTQPPIETSFSRDDYVLSARRSVQGSFLGRKLGHVTVTTREPQALVYDTKRLTATQCTFGMTVERNQIDLYWESIRTQHEIGTDLALGVLL